MFDDIVRHRLERDLGHDPDDARISVRAGDLRAALAHLGRAETPYEQQRRGRNVLDFLNRRGIGRRG